MGDPRRQVLGRAIIGTLITSVVFVAFAIGAKEIKALYVHAPWQDDPYDAVVSFTVFFVPLVAAVGVPRVLLCRRTAPVPVQRVRGLLRGSRVILGASLITVLSDWVSVLLRSHQAAWTSATALLIGLLSVVTVVIVVVGRDLRRASRDALPWGRTDPSADWLADVLVVSLYCCSRLGPLTPLAVRGVRWSEDCVVRHVRAHPFAAASAFAGVFGGAIGGSQAVEDGGGAALVLFFGVATCGMFAFIVSAGAYLELVSVATAVQGRQRRVIDAAVLASAAVPLALACRDWLWWLVGASAADASLARLLVLLALVAVWTFIVAVAAEAVLRLHAPDGR